MRRAGLALALMAGTLFTGTTPAEAVVTDVWTESAYTSVFKDSRPSADAGRVVQLDMARNEFEAGQIVLRRNEAFTIDSVTLSDLTGPGGTIAAANLSYNFVDYEFLNHNSRSVYPLIRYGAGDYPDRLLNTTTKQVAARTTQSIWIRVFAPVATTAGSYAGTARVATSKGTFTVPISVGVRDVTLPDSKDGSFTTTLWQLFTGPISWDEGRGDSMDLYWGNSRYSTQWWALMEKVARMMKQYRTNDFAIPVVRHLMDAGSRQNPDGSFTFNWSRFDQVVEFMMSRGVVKRLEGFWMAGFTHFGNTWNLEAIDTAGARTWVPWNSAAGLNWLDRYIPALRDHIRAKGWESIFWTHIGDEPQANGLAHWRGMADRVRVHWPDVKLGDAVFNFNTHQQIIDHTDVMIPQTDAYDLNRAFYDQKRAEGKELWFYNCQIPRANYLNRFVDQPQWSQRLTMWHAYSMGVTGYLHWAMGNWQYEINDQDPKGDGMITRPDKDRNTVEVTTRYESLRDGIEDYEMLNVLGRTKPGLAKGLAASLVQRQDKYTPDIAYMQRIRRLALDLAGGLPVTDLARSGTVSTGSGWTQIDLGRQAQVDAVNLVWPGSPPASVRLLQSYDAGRWTEIASTNGLTGLNGKARYLRVETPGAQPRLEVFGAHLAKANLAGGRTYSTSPQPNNKPDSGIESTDGVLADAHDDGRTYGYQAGVGQAAVTIDLGSVQQIDSAKVHAYEEYPAYRPDSVRIATSVDGVSYTQRGVHLVPRGPSGIWYDFTFPPTATRHVQVTFTKTYNTDATTMLIDEIEVYAAGPASYAAGRPYIKTRPAPTDPAYPDMGNKESTDGIIAGGYTDGRGYGYRLPTPNQTVTVDLTVDLGVSRTLSQVRVAKYNDGTHDYGPGTVKVYTGDDPVTMTLRRETTTANGLWFELPVTATARYLKVQLVKTRTHDFADYLFLDEVQALDTAATNVALNRPYTKAHPAAPETAYPDTGNKESTDGTIAAGYGDGHGYGYWIPVAGQTTIVDITLDLGATQTLGQVLMHAYDYAAHDYSPDSVAVSAGDDPLNLTPRAETSTASGQWFELPVTGNARYLRIQLTKTRVHDFADYLFVDEVIAL